MTLYDKLSKEQKDRITIVSVKELLQSNTHANLQLTDCTDIYWQLYPSKPFDLTLYLNTFR